MRYGRNFSTNVPKQKRLDIRELNTVRAEHHAERQLGLSDHRRGDIARRAQGSPQLVPALMCQSQSEAAEREGAISTARHGRRNWSTADHPYRSPNRMARFSAKLVNIEGKRARAAVRTLQKAAASDIIGMDRNW